MYRYVPGTSYCAYCLRHIYLSGSIFDGATLRQSYDAPRCLAGLHYCTLGRGSRCHQGRIFSSLTLTVENSNLIPFFSVPITPDQTFHEVSSVHCILLYNYNCLAGNILYRKRILSTNGVSTVHCIVTDKSCWDSTLPFRPTNCKIRRKHVRNGFYRKVSPICENARKEVVSVESSRVEWRPHFCNSQNASRG